LKPFIKWAGGKRWLLSDPSFELPRFEGRYIEPFLGGGAVFFHLAPKTAILSDINGRLIETYQAVQSDWQKVLSGLQNMQRLHSKEFYYLERGRNHACQYERAAQFLYLNRTCFNGLYRENLKGQFNVPIGTKSRIIMVDDDFEEASRLLAAASLSTRDFEETLREAREGDLVFIDPPYTTAHNVNGFIKYNQKIFSWEDQKRLQRCIVSAKRRGAKIILTNADHDSIHQLYAALGAPRVLSRSSVIAGSSGSRTSTTEVLYAF